MPALHKEWKRLDAHGAASKVLWGRFDAALEKTYQPVLEQRAAEAARQEAARAEKLEQCDAWQAWFEQFSLATPDYMALAAKRDEITAQWRAGAVAGFRDERKLRKRRDGLLKRMDAQLDEAQAKETARRVQMAIAAEALRDEPELSRQSTKPGPCRRAEGRAAIARLSTGPSTLWQRFRAACDAIFARRDALRNEQAAQREQREQARAAEQQARDLKRKAEREAALSQKERYAGRFALMAQKAALAEPVETAAAGGEPAEALLAAAHQAWEGLARLQGSADRLLRGRLDATVCARAESLANGRAARAMLIDLEIALELPTPESDAPAARAFPEQAAGAFSRRGSSAVTLEPEAMVVQWYGIAATPDAVKAHAWRRSCGACSSAAAERPQPGACSSKVVSSPCAPGFSHEALLEPLDPFHQNAQERLVVLHLACRRRPQQRAGLDLHQDHVGGGQNGGGSRRAAFFEVQDLAEAVAAHERVEHNTGAADEDLSCGENEKTVARVALPNHIRTRGSAMPFADAQRFPDLDVAESAEKRQQTERAELFGVGQILIRNPEVLEQLR